MGKIEHAYLGGVGGVHRSEIVGATMWIVFTLDSGKEIRIELKDEYIYVNAAWGSLEIVPEASNAIRVGVRE